MKDWRQQALENIKKWGIQSEHRLLLSMMEELGELTQKIINLDDFIKSNIKYNNQTYSKIYIQEEKFLINKELKDLSALMYQLRVKLNPNDEKDILSYLEQE